MEEVAIPIHIHPVLGAFDNFKLAHAPDSLLEIGDFKQVCRFIILKTFSFSFPFLSIPDRCLLPYLKVKKVIFDNVNVIVKSLSCAGAILKKSTCLLRHITTEKSDLCQYAVNITQNTTLKK